MKVKVFGLMFTSWMLVAFTNISHSAAQEGVSGLSSSPAAASVTKTVPPAFRHTGAAHVANGVALRNRASGWIHLRGVPVGSTIVAAYLYWNFSDGSAIGAATASALLTATGSPVPKWLIVQTLAGGWRGTTHTGHL